MLLRRVRVGTVPGSAHRSQRPYTYVHVWYMDQALSADMLHCVEYLNLPELVLFTTLTLSQKVVEVLSDAPNFSRSTSPNSPRPASRTIRVLIGFMCESLRKLFDVKAQRTQPLVEDGRSHTGKPISRHVHSGFYFNPEGGGICPVNWPCL